MGFFKTLFGGKDKSLQRTISENSANAQKVALQLFPSGEANRNLATSDALNVLGGVIPQQLSTFRAGNVGAQQEVIRGLSLANDAILGNPLGGQTLAPTSLDVDTSFTKQQLPQFEGVADALLNQDAGTQALLTGFNSDADLFRAAADGKIATLGKGDRDFFRDLINENPDVFNTSTNFIDDPVGSISKLINKDDFDGVEDEALPAGVLNSKNVRRLSTLLNALQGLRR